MAPLFQIYRDQSVKQDNPPPQQQPPVRPVACNQNVKQQNLIRYIPDALDSHQRFYFDERKLYPPTGEEYTFEEINLVAWRKKQEQLEQKKKLDLLSRENEELRQKLETFKCQITLLVNSNKQMQQQLQQLQNQQQQLEEEQQQQLEEEQQQEPSSPTLIHNRLSIVPQSLQPTHGQGTDMSFYGGIVDVPSVMQNMWENTACHDKFTVPIDQSQYIKENCPTSTPTHNKHPNPKNGQNNLNSRRMSRPSMGGSPTLKLSPITETSRDCNSKSSSSSSALTASPSTVKKIQQPLYLCDEPEQPLDPFDPSTYTVLIRGLADSLESRSGYHRLKRSIPEICRGSCFEAGSDRYLIDKELCQNPKMFTAQLLTDKSDDSSEMFFKTICLRVDQPANKWLYYICNELHKRLVKQKTKPDIELSVMIANPAFIYNDGSILLDEYFKFVTIKDFVDACKGLNRPFPKSVAAYITLELIQLVRQMHICDVVHTKISPKNILITCCPTRDDVAQVDERTSIVKLIGFDSAMDLRLVAGHASQAEGDKINSHPWNYGVDWLATLNCIHNMFFLEDMVIEDYETGAVTIDKQKFKGFPTNVWSSLFGELPNVCNNFTAATSIIEKASDELNTWIKANIIFVLKEADIIDRTLDEHCKLTDKSLNS